MLATILSLWRMCHSSFVLLNDNLNNQLTEVIRHEDDYEIHIGYIYYNPERGNVGLPLANPNYRAIEKIENEFYTQDWGGQEKR